MKEIIILIGLYLVFLILSVFFKKVLLKINILWSILFLPAYLIGIYFYIDRLINIHQILREKHIHLEFGHAEILLLELGLACYATAIFIIINVLYGKYRIRKKTS